ncbi:MAG: NrfD/PsrC family molybdoenzyme membrane anchor subunit [Bacteroidota bacterium]
MTEHVKPVPMTRRYVTPGVVVLLLLAANGLAFLLARFFFGIGAVTNLSDEFPWGIWIGVDVAGGVALAAGGFTSAALGHVMHREEYHVILRPALLTALLGYTFVALGVFIDLGRWYYIWHPLIMWNGTSALFEVGMCVMIYAAVLYIEFLPIVTERFIGRITFAGRFVRLKKTVDWILRRLDRALGKTMFIFVIAGVVLSTLHQSSLGTLMVIAGPKMHPLWQTPILPLLFLLSAISVGYPMVIVESMAAARSFGLKPEIHVLSRLGSFMAPLLGLYLAFKLGDMFIRETFVYLGGFNTASVMFGIEIIVGVVIPLRMFLSRAVLQSQRWLFVASLLVVIGVLLNRINSFLVAYTPPNATGTYFPAIGELSVTVGFVAMIILAYRALAIFFPVISVPDTRPSWKAKYALRAERAAKTVSAGVLLILLAAQPAPGQSREKSAHGLDGVTCSTCHTCDVPTKENPCVRECPRLRLVTVHHSPAEGPDVLTMPVSEKSSSLFLPVKFSHRWHAEMAEMSGGCVMCHHYNPPGGILACSDCHSAERKRTNLGRPDLRGAYHQQCMDCHRKWGHETGCTSCHELRNAPVQSTHGAAVREYESRRHPPLKTPERIVYETELPVGPKVTFHHKEHVDLYGYECADCHSSESCVRCHDRQTSGVGGEKSSGKGHDLCSSCHDTVSRCETCHGTAVKSGFDHQKRTGWALGRLHAALPCSRCHVKKGSFAGLTASCQSCHGEWRPDTFNHAVTGLRLDTTHRELECALCHGDGPISWTTSCGNCHEGFQYPDTSPGKPVSRREG